MGPWSNPNIGSLVRTAIALRFNQILLIKALTNEQKLNTHIDVFLSLVKELPYYEYK